MKMNIIFVVLLALLLPTVSSLYSMQVAEEPTKKIATVSVFNNTTGKLDITYTLSNAQPTSFTLEVEEEVTLPGPLSFLKELYVKPYGQVKGWLSATTLTRGLMKGTNVADLELVKNAQNENETIRIVVKPGGELVETTVGKGFLSSIASAISPYTYGVESISKKRTGHLVTTTLFDQFPQVLATAGKNKPILPRYVLNVGESAEAHTIEAAYERIRAQWEHKTQSLQGDEAKLAQKVIEFAGEAKKSLLHQENTFEKLASENYFYKVPEEEKEATGLRFALAAKAAERTRQNMSPQERAEQRAYMEEMGFVFNDPEEK